nr:hypothetical protein [Tanacetum cinerariifolium]
MSTLKLAEVHNLVVFLSKPTESKGFKKIVDFLNANPIQYALTDNPIVYTSCIEQFWVTVKAKTVTGEVQLQALVDGKKVIITESTVRTYLQLEDAEGVDCLPKAAIFEQLTLMSLKMRFKRLEKKRSSRTHGLKRLYKVGLFARVESSDKESLGEEDPSKKERNIADIDANKEISIVDETVEDQGRFDDQEMLDTSVIDDDEVFEK